MFNGQDCVKSIRKFGNMANWIYKSIRTISWKLSMVSGYLLHKKNISRSWKQKWLQHALQENTISVFLKMSCLIQCATCCFFIILCENYYCFYTNCSVYVRECQITNASKGKCTQYKDKSPKQLIKTSQESTIVIIKHEYKLSSSSCVIL